MQANLVLWHSQARRLLLLKWALCAALLAGLALSPKLWGANRAFPAIPAIEGLPELPQWLTLAICALLVLATILTALLPRPGFVPYGVVAAGAVLVLFDITRLQPWFFQYLLMFLALGVGGKSDKTTWAICAFILASLYFWSGVQKANVSFVDNVFPWLAGPLVGQEMLERLRPLAFAVPIVEAAIGVFLLVPRTRTWGLVGVCTLHASMLLVLGPLGHDINSVVWPWNLAMVLFAFALFHRNQEPIFSPEWAAPIGRVILVAVGVLPALNFVGRWDDYLSGSLYSGKTQEAYIYLSEEAALPLAHVPSQALIEDSGGRRLDVTPWALLDLNVPPYPEPRAYRVFAKKLGVRPKDMKVLISDVPSLTSGERTFSELSVR